MGFFDAVVHGFGFTTGVVIFLVAAICILKAIKPPKKGPTFTVELFEDYKERMVSREDYNEVLRVDKIIQHMNAQTATAEMFEPYEVKFKRNLFFHESGRVSFDRTYWIIKKGENFQPDFDRQWRDDEDDSDEDNE